MSVVSFEGCNFLVCSAVVLRWAGVAVMVQPSKTSNKSVNKCFIVVFSYNPSTVGKYFLAQSRKVAKKAFRNAVALCTFAPLREKDFSFPNAINTLRAKTPSTIKQPRRSASSRGPSVKECGNAKRIVPDSRGSATSF